MDKTTKKPRKSDAEILRVLSLLAQGDHKWVSIRADTGWAKGTIASAKKWFCSLSDEDAEAYVRGHPQATAIVRLRIGRKPQTHKARQADQHQQDLHNLIEQWTGQLKWPRPEDLPDAWGAPGRYTQGDSSWVVQEESVYTGSPLLGSACRVLIYCAIEDDPRFTLIQEHLQGDDIWPLYDEFKETGGRYWYASKAYLTRKEEMEEAFHAGEEGMFSYVKEQEAVEQKTRELGALKIRMLKRLRELQDLAELPGTCSRCRQSTRQ